MSITAGVNTKNTRSTELIMFLNFVIQVATIDVQLHRAFHGCKMTAPGRLPLKEFINSIVLAHWLVILPSYYWLYLSDRHKRQRHVKLKDTELFRKSFF